MTIEKKISAGEIVRDLRSGMSDSQLMEKYGLSAKGLQSLFRKLKNINVIRSREFKDRCPAYVDTVALEDLRGSVRQCLDISMTVHEHRHPEVRGTLQDISEMGLRTKGIASRVDENKVLTIPADGFFVREPISLNATCRWVREEPTGGECIAGFEILDVTGGNLGELIELVQSVNADDVDLSSAALAADDADATESVDLTSVFTPVVTSSGSFSFGGVTKTWFGKLLQALPIPALLIDETFTITFANECWNKVSPGYKKMRDKPFSYLFPNSWVAQEAQSLAEGVSLSRKPETYQAVLEVEGGRMWGRLHYRSIRMGLKRSILVLVEDLTLEKEQLLQNLKHQEELKQKILEREKAEELLRASEEQYRLLVDNAPVGILSADQEGRVVEANRKVVEILGLPHGDEARQVSIFSFAPLVESGISAAFRRCMDQNQSIASGHPYAHSAGETSYLRILLTPMRAREGAVSGAQAVVEDITKRKQLEDDQKLLATAVEQVAESIIITDREGKIQYVNPAFEEISGYSSNDVVGRAASLWESQDENGEVDSNLQNAIRRGEVWKGRVVSRDKYGKSVSEDMTISPVRDSTGRIVNYVQCGHDVSHKLELERELLHAQKMEAVGTLAGGIAHDFNNLLQVTLGYAELLLAGTRQEDPAYADLQKIRHAAQNGAELVRRLLTFSRRVETKRKPLDLNSQVESVKSLLLRTIPKMIEIDLKLEEGLSAIDADAGQVQQILLNLAINARDAMPEGGTLRIETKSAYLDQEFGWVHRDGEAARYVLLMVSDSGEGMDAGTLEHIFEPFYTTKEQGQGTGLGLAVVYGIVKEHSGHIVCSSEPGCGTTFKIYFPTLDAPMSALEPPERDQEPLPCGTETVLLVDDEEFIRDLGKRILEQAGYNVLTAEDGRKALEIYKTAADQISLVILDLIMPGMPGIRCLEEVLKINSGAKVLVASGHTTSALAAGQLKTGTRGFIEKPYDATQMLHTVREVLDGD